MQIKYRSNYARCCQWFAGKWVELVSRSSSFSESIARHLNRRKVYPSQNQQCARNLMDLLLWLEMVWTDGRSREKMGMLPWKLLERESGAESFFCPIPLKRLYISSFFSRCQNIYLILTLHHVKEDLRFLLNLGISYSLSFKTNRLYFCEFC